MKNSYKMTIAGLERELPLFPIGGGLSIGAFIMFGDVEITKASAAALLAKAPQYDILVTAECKSIPLIYEMARQANADNYIIARKGPKLYMKNIIKTSVHPITPENEQILCLGEDDVNAIKGRRVLIVDDVISTGESLEALEKLVGMAGGQVVGKMAVLAEGKAQERDDIIYLEPLPLFDENGDPLK